MKVGLLPHLKKPNFQKHINTNQYFSYVLLFHDDQTENALLPLYTTKSLLVSLKQVRIFI